MRQEFVNMKTQMKMAGSVLLALALTSGCRGQVSEEPPVHLNLNMDFQSNYKPQKENAFFEDGRAMRPLVPGTIPRGFLREDDQKFKGKVGNNFVETLPVSLTLDLVKRGQDRFKIYCTPCHGGTGKGDGMIVKRGMLQPPNFHDDRIVKMPVGEIFSAITNGVRGNMPAYDYAIPVNDRWAIVSYVRALQLSQRASLDMVPGDIVESKGWKSK